MTQSPMRSIPTSTKLKDRAYLVTGFMIAVALVAAATLGTAGIGGPGVLTDTSAFFVGGVAILALTLGLLYVLFTLTAFLRDLEKRVPSVGALVQRLEAVSVQAEKTARRAMEIAKDARRSRPQLATNGNGDARALEERQVVVGVPPRA